MGKIRIERSDGGAAYIVRRRDSPDFDCVRIVRGQGYWWLSGAAAEYGELGDDCDFGFATFGAAVKAAVDAHNRARTDRIAGDSEAAAWIVDCWDAEIGAIADC